ncbi:HAD hydrolase-like protein, partial [Streptomyces sp. SID6013]|nr:HAD hydrolase-like protein [Streptomyces sp. SID6013]
AEVKLATFGLDSYLRLEEGAYGEDGEGRPELLRLALERANVTGPKAVFLGDTPADVAGGRAAGVRTIAVATGKASADELKDAGAESVLDGLADAAQVLAVLRA